MWVWGVWRSGNWCHAVIGSRQRGAGVWLKGASRHSSLFLGLGVVRVCPEVWVWWNVHCFVGAGKSWGGGKEAVSILTNPFCPTYIIVLLCLCFFSIIYQSYS